MEEWRDVEGYGGDYQVSNLGRVKSLKFGKERMLKLHLGDRGYFRVAISNYGKIKTVMVHKLVAMAFLKHKPNGHKLVVDHIDNNPKNNCLDNLQIITQRENLSKDKKGYSSEYVGVSMLKERGKFQSHICFKNKDIYLGLFQSEEEAAEAYKMALEMLPILTDVDKDSLSEFRLKVKNSIEKPYGHI